MGALKVVAWISVAVIVLFGLNFIRTHEFVDVFTIGFVVVCLLALSGFTLYIVREGERHG